MQLTSQEQMQVCKLINNGKITVRGIRFYSKMGYSLNCKNGKVTNLVKGELK